MNTNKKDYHLWYTVHLLTSSGTSKQVVCDFDHDGGRWTVIQRRRDASVDFNRNWTDYRDGFGDLNSEFWLGNEAIHQLTALGNNVLNIKLMDWMGNLVYAEYTGFRLDGENMDYKLNVISFTGTAGMFHFVLDRGITRNTGEDGKGVVPLIFCLLVSVKCHIVTIGAPHVILKIYKVYPYTIIS